MKAYPLEQAPRLAGDLFGERAAALNEKDVIYVGSGKAAIALILSYLKNRGVLPNKMTPILVPGWLGTWVYAQMLAYAFPTINTSAKTPVVFCYHQYGFPQDMDKVLEIANAHGAIVIEDCAHAAGTLYKGTPVGSIGAFGFFSYSKFAFCFALGGVMAKDVEFRAFVAERQAEASAALRYFVNGIKFFSEWSNGNEWPRATRLFNGLTAMAYARYGDQTVAGPRAVSLWLSKRDAELDSRRQNYRLLRQRVDRLGLCDHLEPDDVAPYAVPLNVRDGKAEVLLAQLQRRGIRTGIYHFDFARCVFEPDFRPCVLAPIHSGMTGRGMEIVIEAVDKCL